MEGEIIATWLGQDGIQVHYLVFNSSMYITNEMFYTYPSANFSSMQLVIYTARTQPPGG